MSTLKVAIPSIHSRLHPKVMQILGIPKFNDPCRLTFLTSNISLFFLRGWDIATMVKSSRIDVGFCGLDTILESEDSIFIKERYEQFRSPIGLCLKKGCDLKKVKDRIVVATEYPQLTRHYLQDLYIDIEIINVHGSSEAFARLERIDAIVDIVETGKTLEVNGLYLAQILCDTYPCMILKQDNLHDTADASLTQISQYISHALYAES